MISPVLHSVLLVDDDEISNLFNTIFIKKLNLNLNIEYALNGKTALEILQQNESTYSLPTLLLLDIRMPIMNGWEFLEAYEEQINCKIQENVVIVMLTTSSDEEDIIKAMQNPLIKSVLQKPLSEAVFRQLIIDNFSYSEEKA